MCVLTSVAVRPQLRGVRGQAPIHGRQLRSAAFFLPFGAMARQRRLLLGLVEDCLFAPAWEGEVDTGHEWIAAHPPEHFENSEPLVEELVREWATARRAADRLVRRIAHAPGQEDAGHGGQHGSRAGVRLSTA